MFLARLVEELNKVTRFHGSICGGQVRVISFLFDLLEFQYGCSSLKIWSMFPLFSFTDGNLIEMIAFPKSLEGDA